MKPQCSQVQVESFIFRVSYIVCLECTHARIEYTVTVYIRKRIILTNYGHISHAVSQLSLHHDNYAKQKRFTKEEISDFMCFVIFEM